MRRNVHVNFKENTNNVYMNDYNRRYPDDTSSEQESTAIAYHVGDFFAIGMFLGFCSCILDVIAVAIPWWSHFTRTSFGTVVQTNAGLWTICREYTEFDGEFSTSCTKIIDPPAYVRATRTGNMVGLALVSLGMIICLVYKHCYQELHLLILVGGILFNIAGVLTWGSTINYCVKFLQNGEHAPTEIFAAWYLALFAGFLYHMVSFLVVFKRQHANATVQPTQQ